MRLVHLVLSLLFIGALDEVHQQGFDLFGLLALAAAAVACEAEMVLDEDRSPRNHRNSKWELFDSISQLIFLYI